MVKPQFDELTGEWFVAEEGYAPIGGPFDSEEDALMWIEDWEEML